MADVNLNRKRTLDRYMMATKAQHKMGDLSRDKPNLCHVYAEDDQNWIGSWVTGFGFFDVHFPKDTTRDLTPDEIEKYNKTHVQVADHPPQKLNVG